MLNANDRACSEQRKRHALIAAWLHEIKLDGYRTAARIEGGKVRPVDPHRLDRAARFPPISRRASRPASRRWNISTAATGRRPSSRAYAER